MQRTTRLKAVGMVYAQSAVALARPRVVHVPKRFPLRHIGNLILVAIDQSGKPHGKGTCLLGRHVEFKAQVLIVECLVLHIDGMQLLGYLEETIAIVYQIRGLRTLCQRTLGSEIDTKCTHLDGMLVLGIVTHAHLHIEGTRKGITILSWHGASEEITISQHGSVERGKHTTTSLGNLGKVVGIGYLNAFNSPLQHLR